MNKKADLGDMTMIFSFAFLLIVIGSGIAIGIAMFYSSNYDFRETDAVLLNYKLSKCLLNNQFPEDNIETQLYTLCNINKKVIVGDLDILDDKTISFEIEIPSGAKEGEYPIKLTLYDENDDVFESDDSKKSEISSSLNIAGKCAIEPSQITAVLQSDAVAGKETTIKATITNKGNSETSYQVLLAGYESWASVKSITPSTFSLKAGQSKDLIIVIVPNSNVGGEKEFAIQAVYNGLVTEQKVSIPIAKSGIGITGWSISELKDSFGNNWFIWAIALFNVILVLIIIIIAIKIARR